MEVMVDIALVHKNNALPCLVCKANPAWGLDHGDVDKDLLAAERHGATKMKRGRGSGERHAVFLPSQELRRATAAFTTNSSSGLMMVRQRVRVMVIFLEMNCSRSCGDLEAASRQYRIESPG